MRAITKAKTVTTFQERVFEIEEADVNQHWPDYLGKGKPIYRVQRADVGKRIKHQWDNNGWACWSFIPTEKS